MQIITDIDQQANNIFEPAVEKTAPKENKQEDVTIDQNITAYSIDQFSTDPINKTILDMCIYAAINHLIFIICKLLNYFVNFQFFDFRVTNYLIVQELIIFIIIGLGDGFGMSTTQQFAIFLLKNEKEAAANDYSITIIASLFMILIYVIIFISIQGVLFSTFNVSNIFTVNYYVQIIFYVVYSFTLVATYHRYRMENRRFLIFVKQILINVVMVCLQYFIFFSFLMKKITISVAHEGEEQLIEELYEEVNDPIANAVGFVPVLCIGLLWMYLILAGKSLWNIPLFHLFDVQPKQFIKHFQNKNTYKQAFLKIGLSMPNQLYLISPYLCYIIILGCTFTSKNQDMTESGWRDVYTECFVFICYGQLFRFAPSFTNPCYILSIVNFYKKIYSRLSAIHLRVLIYGMLVTTIISLLCAVFFKEILEYFTSGVIRSVLKQVPNGIFSAIFAAIASILQNFELIGHGHVCAEKRFTPQLIIVAVRLIATIAIVIAQKDELALGINYLLALLLADLSGSLGGLGVFISQQIEFQNQHKKSGKHKVKQQKRSLDEELARANE